MSSAKASASSTPGPDLLFMSDVIAGFLPGQLPFSAMPAQALDQDLPRPKLATLDDVIADMFQKLALASALLDQAEDTDNFLKILAVYSRSAVCLGRLLRDRQALTGGPPAGDFMAVLGQALDEISKELGVDI
jgi:hypothetical protein